VLADEVDSLPQREALVRPIRHGSVEGRMPDRYDPGSGDNPSNMLRLAIPKLHAEGHVCDVVQVRIFQFPK
jgi:hypothetical protein